MSQTMSRNAIKAEALDEAADWLESQAADFTVSKIADEGLYDSAVAVTGQLFDVLATTLRRRADGLRAADSGGGDQPNE